jgi:hypothetical protein
MSIVDEYNQRRKQAVLQKLNSLFPVQTYLDNKAVRQGLAGFYKEVKHLGVGFPKSDNFNLSIAEILMKSVSDSCSSCVKTARMRAEIERALLHLEQYKILLNGGKESQTETTIEPKTIHDLRPNI